jgi:FkbM family methyltransferase
MNLSALVAAAYVEVQRTTGRKPSLTSKLNRLRRRPIEPDFAVFEHLAVPPGQVLVDAGSNRGETIASMRLFQPHAPIVGFEPNPLLNDIIRARNPRDPALIIHQTGLSDQPGQFDLHVPYYKGVPFDGLASFDRAEAASFLNRERLVGFDPKFQEVRTVSCSVETLDSFALQPAVIKIDVQGFEPAVIRGGLATIRATLPIVLMENNKPETDAADLAALGYVPFAFVSGKLAANTFGSLNTFYIHPSTRHLLAPAAYASPT